MLPDFLPPSLVPCRQGTSGRQQVRTLEVMYVALFVSSPDCLPAHCRELGPSQSLCILFWWPLTCGWDLGCCADNCANAWISELLLRTPGLLWHPCYSTARPSQRPGMCWRLYQHHRAGKGFLRGCPNIPPPPTDRCAGASS